eukprot:snap_masked-scaffold92_size382268-processed-gene-2.17 protein:Tk08763 transcript:snap_masked-scaffold92_size382268-processed-gene-2.17-mRNA-1 annotation:"unnamed protein product"
MPRELPAGASSDFVATPRRTSGSTTLAADRLNETAPEKPNFGLKPREIEIAESWQGSPLAVNLGQLFQKVHYGSFKSWDFRPCSDILVLLLTEADYVGGDGKRFKQRVARFYAKRSHCQAVVVCQRSELTSLDFLGVQEFVVIELGLALIPISDQKELPQLLSQLSVVKSKPNPFLLGRQSHKGSPAGLGVTVHKELLSTLTSIPGLGEKKARVLLQECHSLSQLADKSVSDLSRVVGPSQAQSVHNFFHSQR